MLVDINDDLAKRVLALVDKYPLEFANNKHAANKLVSRGLDIVEPEMMAKEVATHEPAKRC
jgi:hypothetical protein